MSSPRTLITVAFYEKNGYLPHKAAATLISIAEDLWTENAKLKAVQEEPLDYSKPKYDEFNNSLYVEKGKK